MTPGEGDELLARLDALHAEFMGHAVHTRNAGAIEENGRAQALAWEAAAGRLWRVLSRYNYGPVTLDEFDATVPSG